MPVMRKIKARRQRAKRRREPLRPDAPGRYRWLVRAQEGRVYRAFVKNPISAWAVSWGFSTQKKWDASLSTVS